MKQPPKQYRIKYDCAGHWEVLISLATSNQMEAKRAMDLHKTANPLLKFRLIEIVTHEEVVG